MQIKEAIARARKDIGISSDDTFIASRYIYSILRGVRAVLYRQEIEKKGTWANLSMQTLERFVLKNIDIAESDQFKAGQMVLKSDLPFPKLMDTKMGKIIGGVTLPNGKRLDMSSYVTSINSRDRRFKSTTPHFYIRRDHFYVANYLHDVDELYVDIEGIYENPEEVSRLNGLGCDNEQGCIYYPDTEFDIPGYLEDALFTATQQKLARALGVPLDHTNNGRQDFSQSAQTNQKPAA